MNQLEAKATITPAALPDSKEPEKTYTKEDVRAIIAKFKNPKTDPTEEVTDEQ